MVNSIVTLSIVAVILSASLRDCASLTRFEQESYDCSATSAPFQRLVLRGTDVGATGVVERGTPSRITIKTSDNDALTATWGEARLNINRQTGSVTVTLNRNVATYACVRASFRM